MRRDTGGGYFDYVRGLMREEGVAPGHAPPSSPPTPTPPPDAPASALEDPPPATPAPVPTLEVVVRFDRKRKGKTFPNADWKSPADPDARIAKMKDGRTRLAYKAEHVIDLESEVILAAAVYPADRSDHDTLTDSVMVARAHLAGAGLDALAIRSAAAGKQVC